MKKLSVFFVVVAGVLWGMASIFVNQLRSLGLDSMQISGMRSAVAAVCMLLFILITDRKKLKVRPFEMLLFALSGICTFLSGTCYFSCMEATSPATAVVLMYTAPIMVMLISVTFLGERFSWLKAVAVLLAFVGCGLVTGIIGGLRFSPWGVFVGFLSGVAYCMYSVITKISLQRGNDAFAATTYSFIFSGIVAMCVGRPHEILQTIASDPLHVIPWILGVGIVVGALPYFFYTLSMRGLPAGVASAMSSIEPMTATIVSVVVFNEQLTPGAVAGIILILLSVILLSHSKNV